MAERSAAKAADATEPRMLLQVLVGEESLGRICELSERTGGHPGQLVPVLSQADVERIVFDGPSRVIDVGVRRRLFTGATRTAGWCAIAAAPTPRATPRSTAARSITSSPTPSGG